MLWRPDFLMIRVPDLKKVLNLACLNLLKREALNLPQHANSGCLPVQFILDGSRHHGLGVCLRSNLGTSGMPGPPNCRRSRSIDPSVLQLA